MCGICGKLLFEEVIPEKELIHKMCNSILHRGPDDEGIYIAPHIGLGQRRLTIIDLNSNACPPLANEDKTIWLVFNGEIYNFLELRKQLQSKGHFFSTNTDTEVIIHLYEEEGVECIKKLRGMFSFALWDLNNKLIFCARDRLGKKPFYFTKTEKSFIFASEIKAITINPEVEVAPNYHAINQYLTHQFVPSPLSAFKGIQKLGPGEFLICELNGKLRKKKYWEPEIKEYLKSDKEEIKEEILRQLRESVKLRMLSDVPLGAFLSGGVDSGTIVALMAEQSASPIKTFSIGFEEEKFNELPYARLVAQKYNTEHHELIVKPNAIEILPKLVKHYNEPFADSSAIPSFYVSQLTRNHVTVALSGDGGDESFAGYENYAKIIAWNRIMKLPYFTRKLIAETSYNALSYFPKNSNSIKFQKGLKLLSSRNLKDIRLQIGTILKEEDKNLIYSEDMKSLNKNYFKDDPLALFNYDNEMDELDWLMRHDQRFYLPDCLNVKMDIASMANGLEVRSPFLDHKFMEFAASIPSNLKRNQKGGKLILKEAVESLLPKQILNKPKTGFGIPLNRWLRTDLSSMMQDLLLDQKARNRGIFEHKAVIKMIYDHTNGRRDWSSRLWSMLFLELWFREFIDNS